MNYEELLNPTIERLKKLVSRQYSSGFNYLSGLELIHDDYLSLKTELLKSGPVTSGDSIFFPVFLGNTLAGAGQVTSSEDLSEIEINKLHQVIRMLIESSLMNIDRLDTLDELENHLRLSQETSNLIRLNDYKETGFEVENKFKKLSSTLNFPCLIESLNPDDIHKMALEIHDHSCRYAFLSINDIDPSVFNSIDELRALGPVSIFIPQIESLSLEQQQTITDYLSTDQNHHAPQFIVGATKSYAELKIDKNISQSFLSKITTGYLYMSEPFSAYKSANIFEFFFEHLTNPNGSSGASQRPYA